MRKTNEFVGLGKSKRPRVFGRDLPVIEMGLQNSRSCRAGYNLEVNLVFQFSSGYEVRDFSITPHLTFQLARL